MVEDNIMNVFYKNMTIIRFLINKSSENTMSENILNINIATSSIIETKSYWM